MSRWYVQQWELPAIEMGSRGDSAAIFGAYGNDIEAHPTLSK